MHVTSMLQLWIMFPSNAKEHTSCNQEKTTNSNHYSLFLNSTLLKLISSESSEILLITAIGTMSLQIIPLDNNSDYVS